MNRKWKHGHVHPLNNMRCVLVPIDKGDAVKKTCITCGYYNNQGRNTCPNDTGAWSPNCLGIGEPFKYNNWKPKEQPMKYKVRDGGFTVDDMLNAEACRDIQFKDDVISLLSNNENGVIKTPFFVFMEVPDQFYKSDTMKRRFLEFGFVEEVEGCSKCRFFSFNNGTGLYCEDFAPKQCGKPCGPGNNYPNFMPIVEKK